MKQGLKQTPIFQEIKDSTSDISSSCSLVGFSSITTKTIYITFQGNFVFIDFAIQGTSNSTSLQLIIPYKAYFLTSSVALNATLLSAMNPCRIQNANNFAAAPGYSYLVTTQANPQNLIDIKNSTGGGFTASGTKGAWGQFMIFLTL